MTEAYPQTGGNKKAIIIIVVIVFVIALSVGGYFWYQSYKKKKAADDAAGVDAGGAGNKPGAESQLPLVIKNMGSGKQYSDSVMYKFNGGKNTAYFYANNRIIIMDATNSPIRRGTYTDGGQTLKMDNGVTVQSGSVWSNLTDAIK